MANRGELPPGPLALQVMRGRRLRALQALYHLGARPTPDDPDRYVLPGAVQAPREAPVRLASRRSSPMQAERGPYQVFDDLTAEEYAALKADIAEHGVLVPIELDEARNVVDGHHRLRAARELGIKKYPRLIRPDLGNDADKRTHARRLNMQRRHLSREQKQAQVRGQLLDTPTWANNKIAGTLGVHHDLVQKLRRELIAAGQLADQQVTEGADGRDRKQPTPREQPAKATVANTPEQEDRAIAAAPAMAQPEAPAGLQSTAVAEHVRRAQEEEQRSAEEERFEEEMDTTGALAAARLRSGYSQALHALTSGFLPLKPDRVAQVLEDSDWRYVAHTRATLDQWFADLLTARPSGLHAVGGSNGQHRPPEEGPAELHRAGLPDAGRGLGPGQ